MCVFILKLGLRACIGLLFMLICLCPVIYPAKACAFPCPADRAGRGLLPNIATKLQGFGEFKRLINNKLVNY